jgi:hypothetical protein
LLLHPQGDGASLPTPKGWAVQVYLLPKSSVERGNMSNLGHKHDKHYLSQVFKVMITSDKSCIYLGYDAMRRAFHL